jgi:hypothetical protein
MPSSSSHPSDADAEMSAAASSFLAALRPEQRKQAQLEFDGRERAN